MCYTRNVHFPQLIVDIKNFPAFIQKLFLLQALQLWKVHIELSLLRHCNFIIISINEKREKKEGIFPLFTILPLNFMYVYIFCWKLELFVFVINVVYQQTTTVKRWWIGRSTERRERINNYKIWPRRKRGYIMVC